MMMRSGQVAQGSPLDVRSFVCEIYIYWGRNIRFVSYLNKFGRKHKSRAQSIYLLIIAFLFAAFSGGQANAGPGSRFGGRDACCGRETFFAALGTGRASRVVEVEEEEEMCVCIYCSVLLL